MTALLRSLPALALLAALFSLATGTASAQTVWINEFHYDNAGVDVGEFVEVVGLAGTNLNGWTVVGYNGSSGTRYRTENLSGTLTNQSNGFGFQVVTYPSNGLQNGAPDGIALVNAAGNVIEFLSYEGTFTAADGPAAGLTSTDIGVSENSGTSTGTSISLQGTGSRGIDFAGATGINETPGAVNVGQTLVAPQDPIVNSTA
ncbi:MAG: endonuclease, partial [Bacteroidota bacterium]